MRSTMMPVEFANKYLGEWTKKGYEIVPRHCPYCHGGSNHDKYTFAINIQTGAFNCKRGSCGMQGSFRKLLMDWGEHVNEYRESPQRKAFKPSSATVKSLDDKVFAYMETRKISRATMQKYGVGSDGNGNIAFCYILDGTQVAVKYRPARKIATSERKMWREEGTNTTTLFGQHLVKGDKLVVCEGEIDCLSLAECGIENVVSVPNGSQDMNWIEANWKWLEGFREIVICGDNDEPGLQMVRDVTARLGAYRCKIMPLLPDCKDANECLYRHGAEILLVFYDGAEFAPVEGVLRLADVRAFDIVNAPKIRSGIAGLDRFTGGFFMGQLSVWTGKSGGGKSTLLGQLMLEAIQQGMVCCAFSGELPAPLFRYWIDLQAAGRHGITVENDDLTGSKRVRVDQEIVGKIHDWYRDCFFISDNATNMTLDGVLKVFEYVARRYNGKVFLLDNLAMLMSSGADYYQKQGDILRRCQQFAKKYDVHVHIVAHPRKSDGMISKEDISGSADITNLADNAFVVQRMDDEKRENKVFKDFWYCDAFIDVLKSRFSGCQDTQVRLLFDDDCKRFYQQSEDALLMRRYGWEDEQSFIDVEDDEMPF